MDVSKFKHDYLPLDKDVTKALEPIYTDLSSRELLERCKGGNTQNNNESYNGLLWDFALRHLHNGLKTIELANFLAVSIFNDGFYAIPKKLQVMDVIIARIAKEYAMERDDRRINQAELRHKSILKRETNSSEKSFSLSADIMRGRGGSIVWARYSWLAVFMVNIILSCKNR